MDEIETDSLFDTSPRALAARFGRRTGDLMRRGQDAAAMARLAASFAFQAAPELRGLVIAAAEAFDRVVPIGAGVCSACGGLLVQHRDGRRRWIGCAGALRRH